MAEKKKIEIFQHTLLKLLVRRGVNSDRKRIALSEGELGYTTDTKRLYIGDGETPGGALTGNKWRGSVTDHLTVVDSELGDLIYNKLQKQLYFWDANNKWSPIQTPTTNTGGGGASSLDGLTDVAILNPEDGNILTYNTNAQRWVVSSRSGIWDSAYNTVSSLSSIWSQNNDDEITDLQDGYTTVFANSATWNIKSLGLKTNVTAAESSMSFDGFYTWQDASQGNKRKLSQKYINNYFHIAEANPGVTTNSEDWDSVYNWTNSQSSSWVGGGGGGTYDDTLLRATSGNWNIAYNTVSNKELNWDTAYNSIDSGGSNWDSVYSTVNDLSGGVVYWDSTYDTVRSLSGGVVSWDSTYDTVRSLSGAWGGSDTVIAVVNANSGSWDDAYNTINSKESNWDGAYNTINSKESNWDNAYNTISNKEPNWDSTYNQVKTLSSSWSGEDADSVYNQVFTLSADWSSAYNTINSKESNWDDTYNTVNSKQSNWDSAYNTVNSKQSNWDSAYNTIVSRQVSWDSAYSTVESNKSNWDGAYNTVNSKQSNWDSAYNTVNSKESNWDKDALQIAASDETTNLATGFVTAYRSPYAFTLSDVRASLTNAPIGAGLKVDILASGVSIFSTIITIDAGDTTSVGSSSPRVISNTNIDNDEELRIVITQVGSSSPGSGLKITFIGNKS